VITISTGKLKTGSKLLVVSLSEVYLLSTLSPGTDHILTVSFNVVRLSASWCHLWPCPWGIGSLWAGRVG